uniref:Uncharacterized protein n=1 Tax=Arundo donax TaxID=35708 RepID=A0A0A9F2H3_ARUDO
MECIRNSSSEQKIWENLILHIKHNTHLLQTKIYDCKRNTQITL